MAERERSVIPGPAAVEGTTGRAGPAPAAGERPEPAIVAAVPEPAAAPEPAAVPPPAVAVAPGPIAVPEPAAVSGPAAVPEPAAAARPAPSAEDDEPAPGDGLPVTDSVLVRLRSRLPEFSGALRRVAEQVLRDPAAAARATIVELAERSRTSPATVTRFCRALGFDGYADLRLGIAGETGRAARAAGWSVDIGREIEPTDPLERVLQQIVAADSRALHDTVEVLDLSAVGRAADAIAAAHRVDIYGIGGSGLVGAELQLCLHRIGLASWYWMDVHNGLASGAVLRAGDVAIAVSHSGQTRETIEMLAEAGSRGATTVALTSHPRSPLARIADLVLAHAMQTATYRSDALSGRHPQLLVLDLLFIAVAQRTHARSDAAFQATARAVAAHWTGQEVPA